MQTSTDVQRSYIAYYRKLWLCADASVHFLHEIDSMLVENMLACKVICQHIQECEVLLADAT